MLILPAIDLIGGKAVRLFKGDYDKMTVYDPEPLSVARRMEAAGARWLHLVDLDGAKDGSRKNFKAVRAIAEGTSLSLELGGGIRSLDDIEACLAAGVSRVIIGTAAVTNEGFAAEAARKYGDRVAVGVDIKDGYVAIRGWTEKSAYRGLDFCAKMRDAGVKTLICTDVAKDGAMEGTNRKLYRALSALTDVNIIASGGVSSLEDVIALRDTGVYGAIIGKAYYTGAIDLPAALAAGKGAER